MKPRPLLLILAAVALLTCSELGSTVREVGKAKVSKPRDFVTYASLYRRFHSEGDAGLVLFRSAKTQAAVVDFYSDLVGSERIASAILVAADAADVPLDLAFSVAWVESRFRPRATNRNHRSIDRGLFQLNSRSFPKLTIAEFFEPETNARNGLGYLRYCFNEGGNDIAALAMYNAGRNRVRNQGAPQMTLDYIAQIVAYRQELDAQFQQAVLHPLKRAAAGQATVKRLAALEAEKTRK